MGVGAAGEAPSGSRGTRWSDEFEVFDTSAPIALLLECLARGSPYYILIRRSRYLLYVFAARELQRIPGIRRYRHESPPAGLAIEDALEIHEHDSSRVAGSDGDVGPHPCSVPQDVRALPSRDRCVAVGPDGSPIAVGEEADRLMMGGDVQPRAVDLQSLTDTTGAEPPDVPRMRGGDRTRATPPVHLEPGSRGGSPPPPPSPPSPSPTAAGEARAARPDEGTDPVRFPSIASGGPVKAGQPVTLTVDLLRERVDVETVAGPVGFVDLPADWESLEVTVDITCGAITFEETTAAIEVRRNADSVPAIFHGVVAANADPAVPIPVFAAFQFGDRICGMAQRTFMLGHAEPFAPEGATPAPFVVETDVDPPDLTIQIIKPDPSEPGKLIWTLKVPRADLVPGMPGRLTQAINLGRDPAKYAADVYQRFADVRVGEHVDLFNAVGDELWEQTPAMFRQAYWAMRAVRGAGFTIQFITDDPHIPWELMRPANEDSGELAEILALSHPIGRWIGDYEGYLRQHLPSGQIVTIAPIYTSVMDELPRAQGEAALLTGTFHAARVPGTLADVKNLLRKGGAQGHVAILHFAGHGEFPPGAPAQATIKLEDGTLAARVVGARETKLGELDGSLVVFNACKVGLSGETLGASGGWADVFLKRRFSGFVAPLWPVYDDDAEVVIEAFFERVARQREPVGRVLQQIRAEHAAASPTFFAYLYYGDVNARLTASIG